MLRPLSIGLVVLTVLAVLGGCGNSRTPVPDLSQPVSPAAFRPLHYAGSGLLVGVPSTWSLTLGAPGNWTVSQRGGPLETVIASGSAVIAFWRYRRLAPVPAGADAFARARSELIDAARAHDPGLQVIKASVQMVGKAPALELDAVEKIDGQPRRVRSTHLFVPGAELVLDEYAPARIFHVVDRAVFSPIRHSLRVSIRPSSR